MAMSGSTLIILKADKLMDEADKKATQFDWFGFVKTQNQENAAELYVRAAVQYKIAKDYGNAGLCYTKSAKCNIAIQNDIEAKISWREAGKCYRHIDYKKAIEAYKNAIELQLDSDRFGQAARLSEEIGDILLNDEHLDAAITAYQQSADYYEVENDAGNRNKRLLKIAHLCGKAKKWKKAIKIFEKLANDSAYNNSSLLIWGYIRENIESQTQLIVPDGIKSICQTFVGSNSIIILTYLFKAMLLQICMLIEDDVLNRKKVKWTEAKAINKRYCDISDIYAKSRECKLVNNIIDCLPVEIDEFKDVIASYDKIVKIESWIFELLYYIEKYMRPTGCCIGFWYDDDNDVDHEIDEKQDHNPFDVLDSQNMYDAPDLDDL